MRKITSPSEVLASGQRFTWLPGQVDTRENVVSPSKGYLMDSGVESKNSKPSGFSIFTKDNSP